MFGIIHRLKHKIAKLKYRIIYFPYKVVLRVRDPHAGVWSDPDFEKESNPVYFEGSITY